MKTMKSELQKWQQKNNQKVTNPRPDKQKVKSKRSESHDERFWSDMMGMRRPRYERRRGSVRQK